jgi:cytochrome c oxidase assembly factor CtaG
VILLAVAVPLTLLALPAWLAGRSLARRRREAALDAA